MAETFPPEDQLSDSMCLAMFLGYFLPLYHHARVSERFETKINDSFNYIIHPPYIIIWLPVLSPDRALFKYATYSLSQSKLLLNIGLFFCTVLKCFLLFYGLVIYKGDMQSGLQTQMFITEEAEKLYLEK